MSTLGLGIIGLGVGKGALLLNGKSDSPIKVRAVADKDPALLKLAHEDHGIGFVTEDYGELLSRSEVDVVGIFTPRPPARRTCGGGTRGRKACYMHQTDGDHHGGL